MSTLTTPPPTPAVPAGAGRSAAAPGAGGPARRRRRRGADRGRPLVREALGALAVAIARAEVAGRGRRRHLGRAAVRVLTDAAGLAPADLAGVGLRVPGLVDHATGTVLHPVNPHRGQPAPLTRLLAEELGGVPAPRGPLRRRCGRRPAGGPGARRRRGRGRGACASSC